ncbi:MAG: LicD family protein [Bacteroidales bacterium]|nr:LicD family protein [Bacteroidales bacterium]
MEEDFSKINGENTPLRKVQLRMLDMLIVIDNICRKNNICYWIEYGTLLGAVRHKGFIPWDDDLDICVHEKDYEKFQNVCMEQLPDDLFLQNEITDPDSNMGKGLLKIRDKKSLFIHYSENFKKNYNKGIFIDVFMAKPYPKANWDILKYLLHRVGYAHGFFKYNPELNLKNIICFFVYPVSYLFHKSLLKCITRGKPYLMGVTPECYVFGKFSKIEDVLPLREIEFEGHSFKAPNNPEARLRDHFGDYMKIPEPENRRIHVVYAFMDRKEGAINVK